MSVLKITLTTFALVASAAAIPALAIKTPTANPQIDKVPKGWTAPEKKSYPKESPSYQYVDIRTLNRAVRLKHTASAYQERGKYFLETLKLDAAIADFTKWIELDPTDRPYTWRGNAYDMKARNVFAGGMSGTERIAAAERKQKTYRNAAIKDYETAIRLGARDFNTAQSLLSCIREGGYNDKADAYFDDFIKIFPKSTAELYFERAKHYSYSGRRWKAIADFSKVLEVQPRNLQAYIERANLYGRLDCHERAIRDLNAALRIAPRCARAFSLRGQEQECTGNFKGAIADYLRAYQLDPDYAGSDQGCHCTFYTNSQKPGIKYACIDTSGKLLEEKRDVARRKPSHDTAGKNENAPPDVACRTTGQSRAIPVSDFSEGLAPLMVGARWAYFDKSGRVAIPPLFERAMPFSDGLALIQMGGKYGFIDKLGSFVVEPQYDLAGEFSDGLAPVLNLAGEPYLAHTPLWSPGHPPHGAENSKAYSQQLKTLIDRWNMRTWSILDGARYGFIDKSGKLVISAKYDIPNSIRSKIVQGSTIDIDGSGKERERPCLSCSAFSAHCGFHEGLAMVCTGDLFGYINTSDQITIGPKFREAGWFADGLALVCINGKYGFIDKTGKIAIQPRFDCAEPFSEGTAIVGFKRSRAN